MSSVNLGLNDYTTASGSATTFLSYFLATSGTANSNVSVIDSWAGAVSGSITTLKAGTFVNINASQITTNYYEGNNSSVASYTTNLPINLKLNVSTTGVVTLNINSLGVRTLKKVNVSGALVDLDSGDLKANRIYQFIYDGTYFVYLGNAPESSITAVSGSGVMSTTTGSSVKHNVSGITTGSYNAVVVDVYGHVISGSNIASGLSAISGSSVMSTTAGSSVSHNVSGISSGSYTRVIVDKWGHVISGSQTINVPDGQQYFFAGSPILFGQDGKYNFFVGNESGNLTMSGKYNVAFGYRSFTANSTGWSNVAIGEESLYRHVVGDENVAVGTSSLFDLSSGKDNTGIGYYSLVSQVSGDYNTSIGADALYGVISGSHNVAVGYLAGGNLTSGSSSIFIGSTAGNSASQKVNPVNSIAIGYGAYTTADNQIQIGNASHTQTRLSGSVIMTSASIINGASGSFLSQDSRVVTVTNGIITSIV